MNEPLILSLQTGAFPFRTSAGASLDFLLRTAPDLDERQVRRARRLYSRSDIRTRHLAIPDFNDESDDAFFQASFDVPVEQRLKRAFDLAAPLVCRIARRAIREAGIAAQDVGQLVFVTNTAIMSPGLDQELIERLGLPRNLSRTCVNYMGCAAGITALRLAHDYVRGLDAGRSHLVSLVVCVETSSLHTVMRPDPNDMVTHSLFADGVACAVIGKQPQRRATTDALLALVDFESFHIEGAGNGIRLAIQTDGISCLLSPRLPDALVDGVRRWADAFMQRLQRERSDIDFWAIHPGGRKIIDKCLQGLQLDDDAVRHTRETLSEFGNVLSCGVFFVLRRMLDEARLSPGERGLALSFAPGVSVEGVLLRAVSAGVPAHSTTGLRVKVRHGAVVPKWVRDDVVETLPALDTRASDVTVCTYPKSGTTWMLQILHLLRNGGEQGEVPLNEAICWLERDNVEALRRAPSPRIIKTHLPADLLPRSAGKTIYVARNPKDVAVSYYYHARAKEDFGFVGDWDCFFPLFIEGSVEGGDWWEHTQKGLALASEHPERVLLVWYEQMHRAIDAVIREVAAFIGVDADEQLIDTVAARSDFEHMRQSALTNVAWSKERSGESPHLRRGSVGDWTALFSSAQERRLEAQWAAAAMEFGVAIPLSPADLADPLRVMSRFPARVAGQHELR